MSHRTVADVITSVRHTTNDSDPLGYKNQDLELLGYLVDALNFTKNERPDLFIGRYGFDISALVMTDSLPIGDQWFRPICDYVIARAETKDAEHVLSGRAELMAKLAGGFLL
jgi:hypothetical protein